MQEQGDEEILGILAPWMMDEWHVIVKMKVPLRELFPEPEQKYLKSIWKLGHADLPVFRHGKLPLIVEPGGRAHFDDEKQIDRDKRKDILCAKNGVRILRLSNNVVNKLHCSQTRKLFKKWIYSDNDRNRT